MKTIAAIFAGVSIALPLAFVSASATPSTAVSLEAASYAIDPVHSSVIFKLQHMGLASFYGRFNKISGTVMLDKDKPEASKVELSIATDTVDTNNPDRDKHLKSPDFFNAKEFPEIKFVSKTAKKDGDKRWKISGDLTLHGVTKPLSVDVDVVGEADKGKKIGFDVTFKLRRSDFGVNYGLDTLGDEVTVMAGIEAGSK